jgi:hypothetical protein
MRPWGAGMSSIILFVYGSTAGDQMKLRRDVFCIVVPAYTLLPFTAHCQFSQQATLLYTGTAIGSSALPPDIENILHDNLDKIIFRSYSITKMGKTEDTHQTWVCGTIDAKTSPSGEYHQFNFAAVYPFRTLTSSPKSWVEVVTNQTVHYTLYSFTLTRFAFCYIDFLGKAAGLRVLVGEPSPALSFSISTVNKL